MPAPLAARQFRATPLAMASAMAAKAMDKATSRPIATAISVLTIRGEKKAETEDRERGFSERYYGRLSLPAPTVLGRPAATARKPAAHRALNWPG
jgi:hypothetical protein